MSDLQALALTIDEQVNLQKKSGVSEAIVSHGVLVAGTRLELWRDNVRIRNIVVPEGVSETQIALSGADWGADGSHEFSVRLVDAETGVAGAFSSAETVLVDTRPPSRPSVISVSQNNRINAAELADAIPVIINHEAVGDDFTLEILVDGIVVESITPVSGSRTTTVDISASVFESGGSFEVTARLADAFGNVSSSSSVRSVSVFAELPDAVMVSDLGGDDALVSAAERASIATITVTHEAAMSGSKIEIWRDDVLVKAVNVATGATSTQLRIGGADWGADGERAFKLRLVDGAGNEGEWSDVQLVTVDTEAPNVASVTSIATDGYVNAAEKSAGAVNVSHGAAAEGDVLEVYVDRVLVKTIALTGGETATTLTLADGDWGADGSHTMRVRVLDAAGNAGGWSASIGYVVDSVSPNALTLPTIARDNIVSAVEKAGTTTIAVQHELSAAGAVLELAIGETIVKTITFNSRVASTVISLTGDDWGVDGEHEVKVRYTDAAGNVGAWSDAQLVTVDSIAASAPVLGAMPNDGIVNIALKAQASTLSIAHDAAGTGDYLELYRDQVLIRKMLLLVGAESTEVSLSGSDWGADGTHAFTARIIDAAGNIGDASTAKTVQVDARAPGAVLIGAIAGDGRVTLDEQSADLSISLTHEAATAGSVLELYRDGALWKSIAPLEGETSSDIVIDAETWGEPGRITLQARLVDGSGNAGSWSAEAPVILAGALPEAVTIAPIATDDIVNAAEKRSITMIAINHDAALVGAKVELYRNDILYKSAYVVEGATTTSIKVFASDWGSDGAYDFKARLVDATGGEGAWSEVVAVRVDSLSAVAPTLPVIAGDGRVSLAEKTDGVTFAVTHEAAETGSALEVYANGVLVATVNPAQGATTTSVTLIGDDWGNDGAVAIRARLIDAAGNIGAMSAESRIIIDTTVVAAPEIAVIAGDDIVGAREKAGIQTVTVTHEAAELGSQLALYRDSDLVKTVAISYRSTQTRITLSGTEWGDDGEHAFTAVITDAAGNESEASDARAVLVATSGPAAPGWASEDGVLGGDGKVSAAEKAVASQVTISHAEIEDGARVELYRDGTLVKSEEIAAETTTTIIELTGSDWGADGNRSFKVRIVDAAGNASAFSPEQRIVVDSSAPLAPTAPSIGDGIINAAEKLNGVTLRISHEAASAGAILEIRRGSEIVKTVAAATGSRNTAFTMSGDDWGDDGEQSFTFRLVDGAGNEGEWSEATTVDVMTAAPAAVVWGDIATDGRVNRAEKLAGVTVDIAHDSALAGSKLEIYRDNRLLKAISLTEGATTTAVDFSSANWGADGVRSFKARIVTADGNVGDWSEEQLVAVDSVAPAAVSLLSIGRNWAVTAEQFSGISHIVVSHELAAAGSVIEIYRNDTLFKTFDAAVGARETEVEIKPGEWGDDGSYVFKARFVDSGGNVGAFSAVRNATVSLPFALEAISAGAINAQERDENTLVTINHAVLGEGWTINLYRGETLVDTITVDSAAEKTVFTLTGDDWGSDGNYDFVAELVGPAEDFTRQSNIIPVAVDTLVPLTGNLVIVSVSDDNLITSAERLTSILVTISHDAAEADTKIVLYRDAVRMKAVDLVAGATSTTVELVSDDLGEAGTYVFTAVVEDAIGNQGTPSEGLTVDIEESITPMDLTLANFSDTSALLVWNHYRPADVDAHTTDEDGKAVKVDTGITYKVYLDDKLVYESTGFDLVHNLTGLEINTEYTVTVEVYQFGKFIGLEDELTFHTADEPTWDIAQVYSPYIDVGIGPVTYSDWLAELHTTGISSISLGFLVLTPEEWVDADTPLYTPEDGVEREDWAVTPPDVELVGLRWGEANTTTFPHDMITRDLSVKDMITGLQENGIDVTVAVGGFSGSEPALFELDVDRLTAIYQSIIDNYGVKHLDLDIEGASLNTIEGGGYHGFYPEEYLTQTHINRIEALKRIAAANPDVSISFTVPVLSSGLLPNSVAMLTLVEAAGLKLDVLNIMAMDYAEGVNHDVDQAWQAIQASINTIKQLDAIGLTETKLGITPMIGINDITYEVFTLENAYEVMAYAQDNPRVASIGIWSLGRDQEGNDLEEQGSSLGEVTPYGSGLATDKYDFSNIFKEIDDDGEGYNPNTNAMVVSAIQTVDGTTANTQINSAERNAVTQFVLNFPVTEKGDKIQILRDGAVFKTINLNANVVQRAVALSGSDWGVEGTHEFQFRLVDKDGAVRVATTPTYVTIDLVAPEAAVLTLQGSGDNIVGTQEAKDGLPLVFEHGVVDAGTKANIYRDGVYVKTITLAADSTETEVLLYNEEWAPVGTETIVKYSVKLVDLAGNEAPISAVKEVFVSKFAALQDWSPTLEYPIVGTYIQHEGKIYQNKWYGSLGEEPGSIENQDLRAWEVVYDLEDFDMLELGDIETGELGIELANLTDSLALAMWDIHLPTTEGAEVSYLLYLNGSFVTETDDLVHVFDELDAGRDYVITVKTLENGQEVGVTDQIMFTTEKMPDFDVAQVFSPYIDVGIGPVTYNDWLSTLHTKGISAVSLGFLVLTPENWVDADTPMYTPVEGVPRSEWPVTTPDVELIGLRWGEKNTTTYPHDMITSQVSVKEMIAGLQANGIDVTVAVGGFSGSEPALFELDVDRLTAMYQAIIDNYGVKHLDLDIEGASLNTIEAGGYHGFYPEEYLNQTHLNRIEALKRIVEANPEVSISFTVPVLPTGLLDNSIAMLTMVHEAGLHIDVLNIMAMDYALGADVDIDQGWNAIQASMNTIKQLDAIGMTETKLGITPMIGINDITYEVFTLEDAYEVMAYAQDNERVASIGIWSLGRDQEGNELDDQGSSLGEVTPYGSGLATDKYDYSNIFKQIHDAGGGYDTNSGEFVISAIEQANGSAGNIWINASELNAVTKLILNHALAGWGEKIEIWRDGALLKTVNLVGNTTEMEISLSGADWNGVGSHTIIAKYIKSGGVVSASTEAMTFIVDTVAPAAPTLTDEGGDNILGTQEATDGVPLVFTHAAADAGTKANIYRNGVLIKTITLATDSTETSVMLYNAEWGTPGTAEHVTYTVTFVDLAGNVSGQSAGQEIFVSRFATLQNWNPIADYPTTGTYVQHNGKIYTNRWWGSLGEEPGTGDSETSAWVEYADLSDIIVDPGVNYNGSSVKATAATDSSMLLYWDVRNPSREGAELTYQIRVNGTVVATVDDQVYEVTGLSANTNYQIEILVVEDGVFQSVAYRDHFTTEAGPSLDIAQAYSPYIDLSVGASAYTEHLADIDTSGLTSITLGSLVLTPKNWAGVDTALPTDGNGHPTAGTIGLRWGENGTSTFPQDRLTADLSVRDMIAELQGKGVAVTISVGGVNGNEPALLETDVVALTAMYQSIIDFYGIATLDIYIDGPALYAAGTEGETGHYAQAYLTQTHLNRIEALKAIKAANPDVTISFTLPVSLDGLSDSALNLLELVEDNGLDLDVVNIIAHDFGTGGIDQGWNVVNAAVATIAQLDDVGLTGTLLGITPMIGVNEDGEETFTLGDAEDILAFAQDNPRVAGLGILSLGRDQQGGETGEHSSGGSGIVQDQYAFSDILNELSDAGSYNPASGLTVLNTIGLDNRINADEWSQTTAVLVNHATAIAGQEIHILRDGQVVKTAALALGTTETSVDLIGVDWGDEGARVFTAVVVKSGVSGTPSNAIEVVLDLTALVAPTMGAQAGGDNMVDLQEAANGLALTFAHDAADAGTKAQIYRDGVLIRTLTLVAGATETSVTLYGAEWGTPGEAGTFSYEVKLVDGSGNLSVAAAQDITVDAYATVADWSATAAYPFADTYVLHDNAVYYNENAALAGDEPGNPSNPQAPTWTLVEDLSLSSTMLKQSFIEVGDEELSLSLSGANLENTRVMVSYIEGQTDGGDTTFHWVGGGEAANANDDTWANGDLAQTQLAALSTAGADVSISFVAASSGDVAMGASDASALAAELTGVSDYYSIRSFDFLFTAADVFGFSSNEARHDLLNEALVLVDNSMSGDLKITFTLSADQHGLSSNSIALLTNAYASGVDIDVLQVLSRATNTVMDDYSGEEAAIQSVGYIEDQLETIGYDDTLVSVTINSAVESFSEQDQASLVNALSSNASILSVGVWGANWGY